MWNVQCVLAAHASLRLACLLLLFNRFFRRQWIFLLRFRFLQFRLIELLNLSHIGVCQTWLQRARSELRASEVGSALWPPPSPYLFCFFFFNFYFFLILKSLILTCVPKHEQLVHVSPKLPNYPFSPSFPLGNHKFIL